MRPIWAAYALLGLLVIAYITGLILRGPDVQWPFVDGWLVASFEFLASVLCLYRALTLRRGRAVPLLIGLGVLSWSIGDFALTAESAAGGAGSPSAADVFYLGFYPLTYVALVLLVRRHTRKLVPASWLDGAVAGLGAAALCACFAFNAILQSVGGSAAAVATNLAYPIGDVLLLALVVGGTAILPNWRRAQWVLLATALAINAAGDTFNLFQSSAGGSRIGTTLNAVAWPVSILLISISVWLQPGRADPAAVQRAPGFLLPGLGAFAGLAILYAATVRHVPELGIALATLTLATVGVRLALSVRSLRAVTEQRHRQSITDELTGLGNRRHLFQVLDSFFSDGPAAHAAGHSLGFLYVDLDHFKEINDSFGHAAGDELLKQIRPRLAGVLRGDDMLVRLGGDELGVILLDTDQQYATTVARRLMAKLQEPFTLSAVTVRISASIGIAFAPADARDAVGLLRCADLAMYRAKLVRSSVEIYNHDIDDGGNRLLLVEELRSAIEGGGLLLHYQPLVDLHTGELSAVEALLRWPHPRLGLVPPLDFLPLAEEAGLMRPLTAWVLDTALQQLGTWRSDGRSLAMSVNVSSTNLLEDGFVDVVRAALRRHDIPADALILEITETTIIGDFEACKRVIAELRELGVAVSIDDFGAGFTSLAFLGSLAVSELKLDRSFITDLAATDRGQDHKLVRATIDLGHALGLRVVAEGIEDSATMGLLSRAGCDLAQGYFISRPMPAQDLDSRPEFAAPEVSRSALKAS
ncbi:MAG TPA: EAL domain-containing protein [Candidatus Acidoferrales bacterium]|nr:EAL domain-containing protein [Candidatus Acidoferrales bacterium]